MLIANTRNHLTVCKQMNSGSFENNVTNKLFVYTSYIYDLVLNNPQWSIYHKVQQNQLNQTKHTNKYTHIISLNKV